MTLQALLYWAGAVTILTGAVFAIKKLVGPMFGVGKRWEMFLEDWHGTPARPGRPAVPGVMERMEKLEIGLLAVNELATSTRHEVFPNSGSSLRDAVDQMQEQLKELKRLLPAPS